MSGFHAVCGECAAVDEDGKVAWRKNGGKRTEGRSVIFSAQPLRDGVNFTITVEESGFPWMSLGVTTIDPAHLDLMPSRARMLSNSVVLHPGGLYVDGIPQSGESSICAMSTSPGDTWTLNWTNSVLQFYHNSRALSWLVEKEERDVVTELDGDMWAVVELGLGTKVSVVPGYVMTTYYKGSEGGDEQGGKGRQQDAKGREQDTKGRQQDTKEKQQDAKGRQQDTKGRQQDAKGRQQDTKGRDDSSDSDDYKPQTVLEMSDLPEM